METGNEERLIKFTLINNTYIRVDSILFVDVLEEKIVVHFGNNLSIDVSKEDVDQKNRIIKFLVKRLLLE